jgi:regulator of sirC expression with transglutaminase-like and TPR domain
LSIALSELAQTPGISLATCALTIAKDANPALDVPGVITELEQLGNDLSRRLPADATAAHRLRMLNHFFFDELGFQGNGQDYYAPENSYIDHVLRSRRGIPISLAVVYMELGRAAGLRLHGMNFPGHFLVQCSTYGGLMVIDVFSGGHTLDAEELLNRLAGVHPGADDAALAQTLRPASVSVILLRMLSNLRAIFAKRGDPQQLLPVLNRMIELNPHDARLRRDRGLTFEVLACPRAAAQDYLAYLSMAQAADELAEFRNRLSVVQAAAARLN